MIISMIASMAYFLKAPIKTRIEMLPASKVGHTITAAFFYMHRIFPSSDQVTRK